ncbi:helix-turn-helix domain-containing protein [Fictibacillus aquaticus]|uniref:HTH cro/C1-type domain-containing protein n=1 Tax=Fictibacillus aquaticus TaxID=2021314 RepID=A0A235F9F3_9BACL|nr:helix-turn-helix domain-containing protein [Fictibacillus aquaticus]OYD57898.1 hypothetical protein CGZ90_08330 [Fictibacillus aquaticus]
MLGQRLKKLRGKRTQEDIAQMIGISRPRYSHYETGRSEPDHETLQKMANLFGVSTDYLLIGSDIVKNPKLPSKKLSPVVTDDVINFTDVEIRLLEEIKKHPVLFHDLANAPEKKIKQLIKMWEFIKKDLEEDEDEDIIED